MSFHSWQYGLLLAVTLVVYWCLARHRTARLCVLVATSLFYYGSFTPWFLWMLLFTIVVDYLVARAMGRTEDDRRRKLLVTVSLVSNLGLLAYFKYTGWLSGLIDPLLADGGASLGLAEYAWHLAVPAGISFYTFDTLSYTIDVYRRKIPAVRSPLELGVFVSFFPHLIAGPIIRAADFLPQLDARPWLKRAEFHEGLWRFGLGLAKKTLLADQIGQLLVDPVYNNPGTYHPLLHAAAIYGFAFQIYCDFSGYSDMAIGSAKLFGLTFKENFESPYRSRSCSEFWRRWHISLSSWVRDYLFISLGGSRGSEWKVARNLMITMVILGLWHGASNLWLVYGTLQGGALVLERWLTRRREARTGVKLEQRGLLGWFVTFHFIVVTTVFIRGTSFAQVEALFTTAGSTLELPVGAWIALAAAAATHFWPDRWFAAVRERVMAAPTPVLGVALGLLAGALFIVGQGQTGFIYFQF
ncbi:MAG TPA: MBOAT family O-acyltransferase [Planctomycetota bacterium]|nr:MBOAT family O-acyltransferase [Planctomycetota bacterium]